MRPPYSYLRLASHGAPLLAITPLTGICCDMSAEKTRRQEEGQCVKKARQEVRSKGYTSVRKGEKETVSRKVR